MYSLFSIIYHDENSMSTGHYYSDILDFTTGFWLRCDDENIKKPIEYQMLDI